MRRSRPAWWGWELSLGPHLLRRMQDREFTELELRAMLDAASSLQRDPVAGRWRAFTRHRGHRWIVIVEPDVVLQVLVIVTAFSTRRPIR